MVIIQPKFLQSGDETNQKVFVNDVIDGHHQLQPALSRLAEKEASQIIGETNTIVKFLLIAKILEFVVKVEHGEVGQIHFGCFRAGRKVLLPRRRGYLVHKLEVPPKRFAVPAISKTITGLAMVEINVIVLVLDIHLDGIGTSRQKADRLLDRIGHVGDVVEGTLTGVDMNVVVADLYIVIFGSGQSIARRDPSM